MNVKFIVNPKAAAGKAGKQWPYIKTLIDTNLKLPYEVAFTKRPMHAAELTRKGILDGYREIIMIGGDGTLNEVVNGFFYNGKLVNEQASLGILEVGTGADFTRSLKMPETLENRIKYLIKASPKKIDIGLAEFQSFDGSTVKRYFINILDFGIGGAVVECVNRRSKKLGGRISFLYGIVKTLVTYENKLINYKLDDGKTETRKINNFIVANGKYYGGGLKAAPEAKLDDGLFDIIEIGNFKKLEAIFNLNKLRKGKHTTNPKVKSTSANKIEVDSDEKVYIDMDGELVGTLPLKINILPKSIPVLMCEECSN